MLSWYRKFQKARNDIELLKHQKLLSLLSRELMDTFGLLSIFRLTR